MYRKLDISQNLRRKNEEAMVHYGLFRSMQCKLSTGPPLKYKDPVFHFAIGMDDEALLTVSFLTT